MSDNQLAIIPPTASIPHAAEAAVSGLASPHSRRVYAAQIAKFLESAYPISRTGVQSWVRDLRTKGKKSSVTNQSLSAVKLLVRELAERDLLDRTTLHAIESIKGDRQKGVRVGRWLTLEEAKEILTLPEGENEERDRALLSLLLGCGLRRAEIVNLTWGHVGYRWGRMALVDFVGKGNRIRTVAVPKWVEDAINEYSACQTRVLDECEGFMASSLRIGSAVRKENNHVQTSNQMDMHLPATVDAKGRREVRGLSCSGRDSKDNGVLDNEDEFEDELGTTGEYHEREMAYREVASGPDSMRAPIGELLGTVAEDRLTERIGSVRGLPSSSGDGETNGADYPPDFPYPPVSPVAAPSKSPKHSDKIFPLSESGVWWIVKTYAARIGINLAPHDLRRSYAALADEGGAPLKTIQQEMGHASIQTTERYLSSIRSFKPGQGAGDHIRVGKTTLD